MIKGKTITSSCEEKDCKKGVCSRVTTEVNGNVATALACWPSEKKEGCESVSVVGKITTCYCKKDKCNSAAKNTLAVYLLLAPLIFVFLTKRD